MPGIDNFNLHGRVALVTGGTSGIGRGIARAFATAGAKVAVIGHRNVDAGAETVEELKRLGTEACFIKCDVRNPEEVDAMIAQTVADLGGLHVAVNNAMTPSGASDVFSEKAKEDWSRAIQGFLTAPFLCCRAEGAYMKDHGGGSIINISSIGGHRPERIKPTTGLVAYYVSKAGIHHMTRVLARDWARYQIRVNSISPGLIRTPATQVLQDRPEIVARMEAGIPLGRLGDSDELGGAALYLASDASSFTTGADIIVDGGSLVL